LAVSEEDDDPPPAPKPFEEEDGGRFLFMQRCDDDDDGLDGERGFGAPPRRGSAKALWLGPAIVVVDQDDAGTTTAR
jgi:hypothetical protein